MKISIKAKSSSDEPYTVDFFIADKKIAVFCSCRAGIYGQLCKHKRELISGVKSRLFDESGAVKLKELEAVLSIAPELRKTVEKIVELEKNIRREQAKLKKIKKEFAGKLKEGIDIVDS